MARRADHSREELAELIVDTAGRLIAAESIEKFSARALSREIGYTAGTLYHHFRDLDDIVTAVNSRTLAGLGDAFAVAKPSSDPRQMLHNYADAFLGYIDTNKHRWNALFEFKRAPGVEVPKWYVDAITALVRIIAICFVQLRSTATVEEAARAGQLVFVSIHSVSSLQGSGRLELVMNRDIATVVHELVDIHIAAFTKA